MYQPHELETWSRTVRLVVHTQVDILGIRMIMESQIASSFEQAHKRPSELRGEEKGNRDESSVHHLDISNLSGMLQTLSLC